MLLLVRSILGYGFRDAELFSTEEMDFTKKLRSYGCLAVCKKYKGAHDAPGKWVLLLEMDSGAENGFYCWKIAIGEGSKSNYWTEPTR